MSNNQMVIFAIKTNSEDLITRYNDFSKNIIKASHTNSFNERVECLKKAEIKKGKFESLLKEMIENKLVIGKSFRDYLLDDIQDLPLTYRLKNGLFTTEELKQVNKEIKLNKELTNTFLSLLQDVQDDEVFIFWNMEESEANALLSY
ncbi:hypothetical protein DOE78_11595 [Bacillus sp. Y1]|nr:hypothetical protein [Bacillus sp. Y1]AYA76029.1 hypothetical protein DOE78_11595 [Bacillus sp. Y1]